MIDLVSGIGVALGFFLGVLGHEIAHHRLADALGDRSPRLQGRLRASLAAHADPLGTYILPGIFVAAAVFATPFPLMFGWGKRHNLNLRMLRNQGRDPFLVLLAGPAATLALALAAGAVGRGIASAVPHLAEIAVLAAIVLATMTVIELLPIPGRDGGRILGRLLSPHASMKMEELAQYDVAFLLVLFLFLSPVAVGMTRPVCRLVTGFECF